jgi:predicted negative regulator of RcsB-dependent stress response
LAIDSTEEEQLESLKRWWSDNGNSMLFGVVLVLAIVFGMRQWQASQADTAGAASDLYQQISEMAVANVAKTISDDDLLAAQAVYSQLKEQYASSIYTRYAALAMAKFNAEKNQLDAAATELQWIIDNPDLGLMQKADQELFLVARQRLARIKLAQGNAQGALELLRGVDAGSFTTTFAETEGDALLQMGDREGAKAAYQKALNAITDGNPAILRLKLQDLGVSALEAQQ